MPFWYSMTYKLDGRDGDQYIPFSGVMAKTQVNPCNMKSDAAKTMLRNVTCFPA